jgi:TIR domain
MNVFLSSAAADRNTAEVLRAGLEKRGLSVAGVEPQRTDPDPREDVEQWIRTAQAILLLIGPYPDDEQRSTWRAALDAVWQDPTKRMVPVLVGGAELPPFVRSAQAEGSIPVIRIDDLKDLAAATEAIVEVMSRRPGARVDRGWDVPSPLESSTTTAEGQGCKPTQSLKLSGSGHHLVTEAPSHTSDDLARRAARFEELRQWAESLKSRP